MTLVYLDTCVWIAKLWTRDSQNPKTIPIFNFVRNGTYTILLSNFVLLELSEFLKRKILLRQKRAGDTSTSSFNTLFQSRLATLLGIIFQVPNLRFQNPNVSTDRILRPAFRMLRQNPGSISIDPNCPICRNSFQYWACNAPDDRDVIHSMIAVELGCDMMITFDTDFYLLQNDPSLSGLAIQIL